MKRIALFLLTAALAAQSGLWAQEASDEPSGDSVLQTARDEYFSGNGEDRDAELPQDADWQDDGADFGDYDYMPVLIGLVPGLSIPPGIYDTSLALGAVGSLTGSVDGIQLAGVFNINLGRLDGFQAAGVFNMTGGDVSGFQSAGVFNMTGGDVSGFQGAGVFNMTAGDVSLFQAAGVFNIAGGTVSGVQAAGVFNIAEKLDGAMLAGVFNIAGEADGVMIGLVNIADELDGLAIGLVNIIGNGVYDLAVDWQFDTDTAYLTYRSGTPAMYSSFYLGADASSLFDGRLANTTMGMGIGHRFRVLFMTADVELCAETPVTDGSLSALSAVLWQGASPASYDWPGTFWSLRSSFGLGDRTGRGPYLGIKTDFSVGGSGPVPEYLRSDFGDPTAVTFELFGATVTAWPKWFVGVRF